MPGLGEFERSFNAVRNATRITPAEIARQQAQGTLGVRAAELGQKQREFQATQANTQTEQAFKRLDLLQTFRKTAPQDQHARIDSEIIRHAGKAGIQLNPDTFQFDELDDAMLDIAAFAEKDPQRAKRRMLAFQVNGDPEVVAQAGPELQRLLQVAAQDQEAVRKFRAGLRVRENLKKEREQLIAGLEGPDGDAFQLQSGIDAKQRLVTVERQLAEPLDPNLEREANIQLEQEKLLRSIPPEEAIAMMNDLVKLEVGLPLEKDAQNKALNLERAIELQRKVTGGDAAPEDDAELVARKRAAGIAEKEPFIDPLEQAKIDKLNASIETEEFRREQLSELTEKYHAQTQFIQQKIDVFDADTQTKVQLAQLANLEGDAKLKAQRTLNLKAKLDRIGLTDDLLLQQTQLAKENVRKLELSNAVLEDDVTSGRATEKQRVALELDKDQLELNKLMLEQVELVNEAKRTNNAELLTTIRAKQKLLNSKAKALDDKLVSSSRSVNASKAELQNLKVQKAGLQITKDQQTLFSKVVQEGARLSGQSGSSVSIDGDGNFSMTRGEIKDPVKLAQGIRTTLNAQFFLPPIIKESLERFIASLEGEGNTSTSATDRPSTPETKASAKALSDLLK